MPFIGQSPASVALTSSDIADGIITNAKLAQDIISADTALAATPADTDEFLVSDAGTLKRMDYSHIKGGGQWTKIVNKVISSTTGELEFVNGTGGVVFNSTYQYYMMVFRNCVLDTADRKLALEISTDTGSTWKTSGYEGYSYQSGFDDSKRLAYDYSMLAMQEMGTDANEGAFGFIMLDNPSAAKMPTSLYSITQGQNSQDPQGYHYSGGATYLTDTAYDGIRFNVSGGSGSFSTLIATLYGATD